MDISVYIDGEPRTFRDIISFRVLPSRCGCGSLKVRYGDGRSVEFHGIDIDGILQLDERKHPIDECQKCGGTFGAKTLGCTCNQEVKDK